MFDRSDFLVVSFQPLDAALRRSVFPPRFCRVQEAALIVAGDVCTNLDILEKALKLCQARFKAREFAVSGPMGICIAVIGWRKGWKGKTCHFG